MRLALRFLLHENLHLALRRCLLLLIRPVFAQLRTPGCKLVPLRRSPINKSQTYALGGMGLAMAAEMNGYPAWHLLELASKIGLSDVQRNSTRAMMDMMKREPIPIGERAHRAGDCAGQALRHPRHHGGITGHCDYGNRFHQSQLRAAHSKYHLLTVTIRERSQIHKYQVLRGYGHGLQHQRNRHSQLRKPALESDISSLQPLPEASPLCLAVLLAHLPCSRSSADASRAGCSRDDRG